MLINSLTLQDFVATYNYQKLHIPLSLSLIGGAIANIYGANGVGKTSLLQSLLGWQSHQGEVFYFGHKISADELMRNLLYIGHENNILSYLTVTENLSLYATLYEEDKNLRSALQEKITIAAFTFGLEDKMQHIAGSLSAGWRRRLQLCNLLLCKRPILLLDEPMTNLDGAGKEILWQILLARASLGDIVLFTSHEPNKETGVINIEIISGQYEK